MIKKTAKLLSKFRHQEHGSAAVDFAFALPFVMLMTLGTIDLGRWMWLNTTLAHAAREGARFASVHSADSDFPATKEQVVSHIKANAIGPEFDDVIVDVVYEGGGLSGSRINITLRYPYKSLITGFIGKDEVILETQASITAI